MMRNMLRYARLLIMYCALFFACFIGGMGIAVQLRTPTNDKQWASDVQVLPKVVWTDEHHVSLSLIRDFRYNLGGSFESTYVDRVIDVTNLTGVSVYYIPYWFQNIPILHVMLSFEFSDGEPLVVSAETRREKGEGYSIWRGFFNEYELLYVLATERDAVRRRFMLWGEESVYRYELVGSKESHELLLRTALARVEAQYTQPQFYNTFSKSCITVIADMIKSSYGSGPSLLELSLYPQWFDRYMYYRGLLGSEAFATIRFRAHLPPDALHCEPDDAYSVCIRDGTGATPQSVAW